MAETFAEATAGSGLKWHSWTRSIGGSTVHAGFTLPDEYPYASYTAIANAVSGATANSHMMQVMAGSSLNVRIRRILVTQNAAAAAVAVMPFSVVRLTTAGTGGTAVTPSKDDGADSASGATAMTLPSSKGTEGAFLLQRATWAGTGAIPTGTKGDFLWEQLINSKPIIIAAGTSNGIAIKNTGGLAGTTYDITVEFVETAFV